MYKEWLTAKELVGLQGLPMTTQGINAMARRENWVSRKRRGIQGKALEYHISSLPIDIFESQFVNETSAPYQVKRNDNSFIWQEAYNQLSNEERDIILTFIMREGALALIDLINNK
ncbi:MULTISPECIES: DNA-binding protein [Providencia]|uniref:DNA-binding protein n=2 Tax=Providencia TaxID=586 RepID=A0AA42FMS7_9GAMM|nr:MULTISPECIES: DNA-binding protein [Providencia]HCI96388.1 DNA-binding protein [Providencia sp.]APC13767.1 Mu DNA-binding domain protein [Providencia rettgeri]AVL73107.1 DNA-binding protein [Providencia rettgeri]EIL1982288.1 putative DNA-binding transcriptional regulator [Providencia rettgeri]EIU7557260.1 putative DNA-binding transcriptional regulator [Providencia rettgeri]